MFQFVWRYRKVIVLGFFLLFSLGMMSIGVKREEKVDGLRKGVIILLFPLQKASTTIWERIQEAGMIVIKVRDLKRENERLKKELSLLAQENNELKEEVFALKRYRELLDFKSKVSYKMIPATVIGRDPRSWFGTIVVDRGSRDGIERNMAVVSSRGIVGRTIEVTPVASKILLIIDPSSGLSAIVQRTRSIGLVTGWGNNLCKMKYLTPEDDVEPGDVVISSGEGGIFPKGLLVGTIAKVERKESALSLDVEVKPNVDFTKLEEVLIIKNF